MGKLLSENHPDGDKIKLPNWLTDSNELGKWPKKYPWGEAIGKSRLCRLALNVTMLQSICIANNLF